MILYSKSGDFIGIGKDELSFLGYEDLDEFKSVHKDVADMFINKPGYIFKFKNFSWIDYTLHSGAPKKSVIIKLKNGNEVEVPIKIKEIFLYENNKDEIQYAVEFSNNMSQNASMQQSESSFIQATPTKIEDLNEPQEIKRETTEIDNLSKNTSEENSIDLNDDFQENEENDFSVDFNSSISEDKPQVKLEVNEDIFQKEDIEENFEDDISVDFNPSLSEDEPQIKLKANDDIFNKEDDEETNEISLSHFKAADIEEDFLPELDEEQLDIKEDLYNTQSSLDEEKVSFSTISEDLSEDYIPTEEPIVEIKKDIEEEISSSSDIEEKIEFDLVNCAEELGLDISTIAEVIEDYIEKINQSIPEMKSSIENHDIESLQNNLYELKGISDNLRIKEFSEALAKILQAENIKLKKDELNKFEKIIAQFKGELI